MKQYLLLLFASMIFAKLNAQDRSKMVVMKFVSVQEETVLLCDNDIELFDEHSFKITDTAKIQKLKDIELKEVYFVCKCCGDNQVHLSNILSSSSPLGNLYIFILGKNKIHFINDSFVECSPLLIKKIRDVLN